MPAASRSAPAPESRDQAEGAKAARPAGGVPDEGPARPDHLRRQGQEPEEAGRVLLPALPGDDPAPEDPGAGRPDRRFRHRRGQVRARGAAPRGQADQAVAAALQHRFHGRQAVPPGPRGPLRGASAVRADAVPEGRPGPVLRPFPHSGLLRRTLAEMRRSSGSCWGTPGPGGCPTDPGSSTTTSAGSCTGFRTRSRPRSTGPASGRPRPSSRASPGSGWRRCGARWRPRRRGRSSRGLPRSGTSSWPSRARWPAPGVSPGPIRPPRSPTRWRRGSSARRSDSPRLRGPSSASTSRTSPGPSSSPRSSGSATAGPTRTSTGGSGSGASSATTTSGRWRRSSAAATGGSPGSRARCPTWSSSTAEPGRSRRPSRPSSPWSCPPPLIGLAKKKETIIFSDGRPPVNLPLEHPGLRLLQRLRDEAHRFANTYNADLRSRKIRESLLDEFPGLGPVRRAALLGHFGDIGRLKAAAAEDIRAVPGFGPKLASELHAFLSRAP